MAMTNFSNLAEHQVMVWRRDVLSEMKRKSFILRTLAGKGPNNPIELITDLKKTVGGGMECIMTLVADLTKDGGVGSKGGKREGVEEKMMSYEQKITIDELYHSVRNEGKLADQGSVVNFREQGKEKLAKWLAERADQLAFLTLSGISYAYNLDGSARDADSALIDLNFASGVTAPSAKRHRRWDATDGLVAGNTAAVDNTADVPTYKMLTAMKAYAKSHKMPPLEAGGREYYIVLMAPMSLMALKNDTDYKNAIVNAGDRGANNPFFTGGIVTIDGLIIHEHDLVYTTNGATTKWGGGSINGSRTLMLGAQALGFADLGAPEWVEKGFEYDSQQGIYTSKIFGLKKPVFYSTTDKSTEDFGVLAVDHYMPAY